MKSVLRTVYYLLQPIGDPWRAVRGLAAYPRFLADLVRYRRKPGGVDGAAWSLRPILEDRTKTSGFDAHYTYLGAWAMRHIASRRPARHVDVGGQIGWIACVAGVVDSVFIDIRPFTGTVPGLTSMAGSVLAMPFPSHSLDSLSCLHVAEHIGLGRYGDPLDPAGMRDAMRELARVVAPGGSLYFATPIGRPQVVFNAHRVSSPEDIVAEFAAAGLALRDFAGVGDDARFYPGVEPAAFASASYACGMFHFVRC